MIEISPRKFVAFQDELACLMRSSLHIKFALLVNFGDHRTVAGAWSTQDNSVPALLARGVVFMTCHNAIWELAETLHAAGSNPDKLAIDALAADLTCHSGGHRDARHRGDRARASANGLSLRALSTR
ncbi:hypothetical protein [Paraburkholderia oxyphila]|uniref:hypothetical protein n=1 Tax=Paraburkholderia oxyphila TaxID=614212 RepID=UPI000481306B|nr:hypothetical protein [Paraburkholderia oxyphila]